MDDHGEFEIFFPSWNNKNPSDRLFIISCFIAVLIGILTIAYTAFQWRRNINLSWMRAITRSKTNPKAKKQSSSSFSYLDYGICISWKEHELLRMSEIGEPFSNSWSYSRLGLVYLPLLRLWRSCSSKLLL